MGVTVNRLKYHFHGNGMSDFKMVFTGWIFEGFRLSNDIEIMMITKICDREKKTMKKKIVKWPTGGPETLMGLSKG